MASSLSARVRRLEECVVLLGEMAHRMRYLTPGMQGLILTLAGREQYQKLPFLGGCRDLMLSGEPFPQAWKRALDPCESLLGREETALLRGLGDTLGQTDLESQLDSLSCTRELLDQRVGQSRKDSDQKGGLYRTMGVLTGAALFILLI